ncbi:ABC transporter permease [Desulfolutivibrio sp.]|uniref:ABC transporter permease n=1 Tax=Desulfolutivibrio sp. TaxID=2773296 RepID=UPI002F966B95
MPPRQSSFSDSLRIQHRVINAVLRREFLAITGKRSVGFLILVLEPLIFVVFMVGLFYVRGHTFGDIPVVAFAISGYTVLWGVRFHIQRVLGSLQANIPLLYHRHVKVADIILARGVVQSLSTTISFLFFIPLVFFDVIDFPNDPALMIFSWIFVQWYGISFAFIAIAISGLFKFGQRIAILLAATHIFITGAFYMVAWIPAQYQGYVLLSPMVHATEMMRDGLFGNIVETHYSVQYMIAANIILTYIGLALCRKLTRRGVLDDSD